jgi:hypothetical protein
MPKICVQSPEVVSQGEINIHARVNVTTKAKLDEITVAGSCGCDGPPPPPPDKIYDIDIVFLVDGSDSFERTKINDLRSKHITQSGLKESRSQFAEAMQWCGDFVNNLGSHRVGKTTSTIVQFSGIKKLEDRYEPDNDGDAFVGDDRLKHYKVEYGPKLLEGQDGDLEKMHEVESLDGNSQLYLALQDMSSDKFIAKLNDLLPLGDENRIRKRILVIITDEEWDVRNLKSSTSLNDSISSEADLDDDIAPARRSVSGRSRISRAERAVVPHFAHSKYTDMFTIIVRTNKVKDLNEDFITKELCKGEADNYFKVYTDDFHNGMDKARNAINKKVAKW